MLTKIFLPGILALTLLLSANCAKPRLDLADPSNIHIINAKADPDFPRLLSLHKATFEVTNTGIVIKQNNNALIGLRAYGHLLTQRLDIISNNIANASTTKMANQGTFTRKIVSLTQSGKAEVREDMSLQYKLVYDPTHPDAQKSGPNRGYVQYPNVSVITEMNETVLNSGRLDEVKLLLRRIDPGTAIF